MISAFVVSDIENCRLTPRRIVESRTRNECKDKHRSPNHTSTDCVRDWCFLLSVTDLFALLITFMDERKTVERGGRVFCLVGRLTKGGIYGTPVRLCKKVVLIAAG